MIYLFFVFQLQCLVGDAVQLVGRPISLQFINLFLLIYSLNNLFFIDLFSLFFNSFTFIFQLQYPVGNAVQ